MGTTLDALNAGGCSVAYVVQIEGYDTLLVSRSPAEVLVAWQTATTDGHADVQHALSGLTVEWQQEQNHTPWKPFPQPPMISFVVVPGLDENGVESDAFGDRVFKRTGNLETSLVAEMTPATATVTVRSTAAFPSSGVVHVGSEAIAHAAKASTQFQTLTRGKYSPFHVDGGARFARAHRAFDPSTDVSASLAVRIPPVVGDEQRSWVGRWFGVWICRVGTDGVVDGPDEALLAYAGQLAELDEGKHGETRVEGEHALRTTYDRMLLADQFRATLAEGVDLVVGASNDFTCSTTRVTTTLVANPLTIVPGAPASVNEIQAGKYTVYELGNAINAWLQAEYAASRLVYSVSYDAVFDNGVDGPRGVLSYSDSGGAVNDSRNTNLTWPTAMVSRFLGWDQQLTIGGNQIGRTGFFPSPKTPLRFLLSNLSLTLDLINPIGTWVDQAAILPPPLLDPSGLADGVVRIGDAGHAVVQYVSDSELTVLFSSAALNTYLPAVDPNVGTAVEVTVADEADMTISQVIVAQDTFKDLLLKVLLSTGSAGFNHATYDALGAGLGCAIPYSLLGDDFVADVEATADASEPLVAIIRKPTRFVDLFNADFLLRWCFMTWGAGRVRLRAWGTPTEGAAVLTIDDSDKALPVVAAGNDQQRSTSVERFEFLRNVVTVYWGQDADGELVQPPVPVLDVVSMAEHGDRSIEVKARNTLAGGTIGDFLGVLSRFVATLPLFSRPHRVIRRTMGLHHFEQLIPGTFVAVTDRQIRDPESGRRYDHATGTGGMVGWPGIVIGNEHTWGGARPGLGGPPPDADDPFGEVEIMVFDRITAGPYSPAAQVDETATGSGFSAGYNNGTLTLKLRGNEHSEVSGGVLDSSRFAAGDKVRILQIDPDNTAAPVSWQRTLTLVTPNELVVDSSLIGWDPALIYRVIPDWYSVVVASQRATVYQANDADGLVENLRQPYGMVVSGTGQQNPFTVALATELPARASHVVATGDGVPLDVAHARDMARLVNNQVSYKSALQAPRVFSEARSGSPSGSWLLVEFQPVFVGIGILSGNQTRKLYVAPMFRSKDGSSVSVRVTLGRLWPQGASRSDVTHVDPYVQATFTTTATTFATPTAQAFDIRHLNLTPSPLGGIGWLSIEVSSGNAETIGLGHCRLGPVVQP